MRTSRVKFLVGVFIGFFIIESLWLFYWHVIWGLCQKTKCLLEETQLERGRIYDRNGKVIAMNEKRYSVFADPYMVNDPVMLGNRIGEVLNKSPELYIDRLKEDLRFVWIERKLDLETANRLLSLNRRALFIEEEYRRIYLNDDMKEIIGSVDVDNNGLSGIELALDDRLKKGIDVYLSIDSILQAKINSLLEDSQKTLKFDKGIVIVMSPYTGEVLAMVNFPHTKNSAIQDIFEPGSSLKPIVASIALEEGCVREDEKFNCRPPFIIRGVSIKDAPHDVKSYDMTLKEIIEVSSNIGMAQVGMKIGVDLFYRYIVSFGFGSPTGIEIAGETSGMLPFRRDMISLTQNSFGQGIAVNALQLISSYAPLANGGYLVRPTILKSSSCNNFLNQIISSETSRKITDMLVNVVENGTGKKAKVEGIEIAGKTGTAQKVINGYYSMDRHIVSFLGYLPAYSPRYIIGVILDEPKVSKWASDTAAPLFKEIAEILLYDEQLKGEKL
ncbi:MAG: penicillin-binding protein 2 [bacterium]|nr:penicillin-binding protein 2 [bacterium]